MKKMFVWALAIIFIFSMSVPVFAAENNTALSENLSQNYNVTPNCPWEHVSVYGVNPPTEAWNINTQGVYSFSGKAAYSRLYLSKMICGCNYFAVNVTNRSSSNSLTVNPHDGIPVAPFRVAPRSTTDPVRKFMLRSGANYFSLSFEAPSNFEGYVSEWVYE